MTLEIRREFPAARLETVPFLTYLDTVSPVLCTRCSTEFPEEQTVDRGLYVAHRVRFGFSTPDS